jgi:hypothetical protein
MQHMLHIRNPVKMSQACQAIALLVIHDHGLEGLLNRNPAQEHQLDKQSDAVGTLIRLNHRSYLNRNQEKCPATKKP